ncbi:MAG: maltose ABC transporter permease MalF [Bdellovibrionales bacterium]|nr:maltose ABC transporter permease MalF [Bdellovibrionales bacterium]
MTKINFSLGLFLTALSLLAGVSVYFLISGGYFIVTGIVALLFLGTLFIFLKKDLLHYRFMYPGLVTFFLFMILPICFSIYVGFTNLSTGHFLSPQQVHRLLLEEKWLADTSSVSPFLLYKNNDQYTIVVKTADAVSYQGTFSLSQEDSSVSLDITGNPPQSLSPLPTAEVFAERKELERFEWQLPSGKTLRYFRSDQLADLRPRFKEVSSSELLEIESQVLFKADPEKGQYRSSEGDSLAPGFYVNIGLQNFKTIWTSPHIRSSFFKVSLWTLIWATVSVLSTFCLGMILALFLNDQKLKGKRLYRVLLVVPYSIPFFISALIFKGMLNQDFGVLNEGLKHLGAPAIPWLTDPFWAKISALTVNLWLGFPYMFLLITGILQSIPKSLYEAASIDGANRWQSFRRITLPMILSAITPLLIGSFAFNLNNFVGIYLLTGGGPPIKNAITPVGETDILISYTYRLAFEGSQGQDFGLASSISLFIFVIIALLTLVNFKLSGMMNPQEVR